MNPLTRLLDWVAERLPMNIKWHSDLESDHYQHPLDAELDEPEEHQPSLFD